MIPIWFNILVSICIFAAFFCGAWWQRNRKLAEVRGSIINCAKHGEKQITDDCACPDCDDDITKAHMAKIFEGHPSGKTGEPR